MAFDTYSAAVEESTEEKVNKLEKRIEIIEKSIASFLNKSVNMQRRVEEIFEEEHRFAHIDDEYYD